MNKTTSVKPGSFLAGTLSVNLLALEHAGALQALALDPAIAAMMGIVEPVSFEAVRDYVARNLHEQANCVARLSVIRWGDVVVGICGLHGLFGSEVPELKCWVGAEHRQKGAGTFAVRMALQLAFNNLGLSEVRSVVAESNVGARRVAVKNGFRFRGLQPARDALSPVRKEEEAVYEITRAQWLDSSHAPALSRLHPDLKRVLQAELAAGNEIAETGGGWPAPGSVFVKLRHRFRADPAMSPSGIIYTESKSPHGWLADYSAGSPVHILACGES